ncbi:MAG TPA: NAD(P)/FAD-dependent oxidoreductase [Bacteroidales bacterium]|nr:NAD(P)/FAD-dependent oxidoreductase [Bacteroidales bacterium]
MLNIPETSKKRIAIVGCGFAGLNLGKKLRNSGYQVVIIDKHNYHQFPPLFYQVASAGLEESSILFPLRKIFQEYKDFHIRKAEITEIKPDENRLITSAGEITYDNLVLAHGATNSFFGSKEMKMYSKPMKTISEVLDLRNKLLMNFENALIASSDEEREMLLNIVIIGGGPSGVEISGALAEMNKYVLSKDYPDLKGAKARIFLIEGTDRILNVMSVKSSVKAKQYLENNGVKVMTNTLAKGCNEEEVFLSTGEKIRTGMIIWTAGIRGNVTNGLAEECFTKSNRIIIDRQCRVKGYKNIFAIGDIAYMQEENYPSGHPQVAPVAIQQAIFLGDHFKRMASGKAFQQFRYKDKGTMATIGRNLAVVELPFYKFQGVFAWFVWMFIHLMSIVGVKNKLIIFLNWAWNYITYDQSTRLILRPKSYTESKESA